MTSLDNQLWELICSHKMPADASGKPFTDQLMDENDISRETAEVAITEYRKFMYLCATRPERNVPSQAVDLVWHLHMQHSRDYWDVFCKKLGKPVHHNPGSIGPEQLDHYKATVAAYERLFGRPPRGIWKQSKPLGAVFAAVIGLPFACFLFLGAYESLVQARVIEGLFFLGFSGYAAFFVYSAIQDLTTGGQFTLVFESGDPFVDDNAGDCGSGDGGGGCGD